MIPLIPCELILHICGFLTNPKDVRNLALTNKENYILIKKYFIDKEKWLYLSLKDDKLLIKNLVMEGSRFVFYNKKFQYIYNLGYNEVSAQIMTNKNLISSYYTFHRGGKLFKYTKILLLTNAPYNLKNKPLKI